MPDDAPPPKAGSMRRHRTPELPDVSDTEAAPRLTLLVLLAGLGMVGPFTIDAMFPAFPQMGEQLTAGPVALQQLISVYMLAFAAMSLLHGPLSDALGRRPVILVGLALYAVMSIGCALSTSLPALLLFRAGQGVCAGAGQIVSRAVVRDLFRGAQAQRVMSQIAMIFGLAPALAPIIGGMILRFADWRGIFWFLLVYAVLLVVLTAVALPETHPASARTPLQFAAINAGLRSVWSDPGGRRLALTGMFAFAGMFLYISSAPAIVVTHLHRGEQDYAVLFLPLIGGMVLGSWASGRLAGRITGRRMATIGYATAMAGLLITLGLSFAPADGFPWPMVGLPLFTAGVGLTFPVLTLAMLDLFPAARGAAASVQSFVQLLANAFVAGALAPLLGVSLTWLAIGALVSSGCGWLLWEHHLRRSHQEPHTTRDAAAYEPLEDL